ncbi:FUSC family protein [Paenibacillus selenitireducens]|uniref:FUSC family protein n=1 Tax=Paenibacillus selenitireducens TaxID=1324314 RepID=A0A1T2XCZ5_9BACL|nr:aromatic acid exporter family protein [Paenibacillus selenitireducens]OPA77787.1 FUSC family protein [Paenibacillus selenitireducens]
MKSKIMIFINNNGAVWKIPLASALSWEIAKWAGSNHPYLAPLTVILSIQATVSKSIQFAWQRILGTIAGVLLTASIAPYIGLNGWSIGLMLLLGSAIVMLLKWDHAVMIQIAISILLVMYFQSKMPSYPIDRIRDTMIGAAVAVLIHMLILPPDSMNKAKKKMIHFADHLTNHFYNTAQWVEHGCSSSVAQTLQAELQTLFQELHQATTELEKANQSLQYNLLAQKKRKALNQVTRQMDQLRLGYANLSDMIRVLMEWSDSSSFTKEEQRIWADHLNTLAVLIKGWKKTLDDPDNSTFVPDAIALQMKTPSHLENYQYPLALYMNAEQVIQDFQ